MTTPLTRPDAASPRASAPASGPLVITGAAGGLGRAFAVEAARRGWALILTDVAPLEPLATHLSALGATVDTIRADLATADGRDRLFAALPPTGIGGLVNVAGVDYEGALVQLGRDELFDIVRVNVEATLDVTREVALRRDPARRFVLITVCSLAAVTPMPYKAAYAASKRFLLDASLALREELAGTATVTALCPAGLPTSRASVRGIFAQGVLGRLTAVSPGTAAAAAFDAAAAGRAVCVPGPASRMLARLARLAPRALVVRVAGRRWARARLDVHRATEEALDRNRATLPLGAQRSQDAA